MDGIFHRVTCHQSKLVTKVFFSLPWMGLVPFVISVTETDEKLTKDEGRRRRSPGRQTLFYKGSKDFFCAG